MVDISGITFEKLCAFTALTKTLVTIDAPLFGTVLVFNGQVIYRGGSYVQSEKIGNSLGLPGFEEVLSEASRFWIVDQSGVRHLKCRDKMAELLNQVPPRGARPTPAKSVQTAANG